MRTILTIAGSDPSGGAGIEADIKVITAHRQYAMSVITALTAQNTCGVFGVLETPAAFVTSQLSCVLSDIPPDAVKIGMTANAEIICAIGEKLRAYAVPRVVLDPLMISTSGRQLLAPDAVSTLCNELFPLATLVTPNIPEAETLVGRTLQNAADRERAAAEIEAKYGCSVLLKGGHAADGADDLLCQNGKISWFCGTRIATKHTHGTGCTLSSAIACGLADGLPLTEAIRRAKQYLTGALAAGLVLGHGNGPLPHWYNIASAPFPDEK